MNRVSPLDLGRKIIKALAVNAGENIDVAKLRDGSVLIRKAEAGS